MFSPTWLHESYRQLDEANRSDRKDRVEEDVPSWSEVRAAEHTRFVEVAERMDQLSASMADDIAEIRAGRAAIEAVMGATTRP
ncbi:hypothetical protein ASF30_11530 [Leifsonia sp. Leaf264]|nr:hypothetical protein ASF30_11530 [Leifsonia sp. Leaf264]